jgi:hypothetical protein
MQRSCEKKEKRKTMRRTTITLLALMALASFTMIGVVLADSPHYKKGPTVIDNGLTATATGTLAGLGNGNVLATLSFPNAKGTTICTNQGGNQAPGRNPGLSVPVSGTASIGNPKNGTLSFTVTTAVPANPTPQAAGCPNGNWTATWDNITFGSGILTIQQDTCPPNGCYATVISTNVFLP